MLLRALIAVAIAVASAPSPASVVVVDKKGRLPRAAGGAFQICWAGPFSDATQALVAELENYLSAQLTGRAGIPLEFKADCLSETDPFFPVGITFFDDPLTPEGIRSEIRGHPQAAEFLGHPMTYSGGIWAAKNLVDINLSSRFENVNEQLKEQSRALSPQGRLNLQKSIALHELLHAFGFAHEHSHRDSTCDLGPDRFDERIHTLLTAYDPLSILDYCRTHTFDFETGALELSALDIEGLEFYRTQ